MDFGDYCATVITTFHLFTVGCIMLCSYILLSSAEPAIELIASEPEAEPDRLSADIIEITQEFIDLSQN